MHIQYYMLYYNLSLIYYIAELNELCELSFSELKLFGVAIGKPSSIVSTVVLLCYYGICSMKIATESSSLKLLFVSFIIYIYVNFKIALDSYTNLMQLK